MGQLFSNRSVLRVGAVPSTISQNYLIYIQIWIKKNKSPQTNFTVSYKKCNGRTNGQRPLTTSNLNNHPLSRIKVEQSLI